MVESDTNTAFDGIAIIGIAGHFPEANSITQFWQNLINEKECISTFSIEEARAVGVPESVIKNERYVRRGGRIKNPEMFDAAFFGFTPKDAKILDPQQRLFLKCGWEAIESAGYDVSNLNCPVGVFGGCSFNYYLLNNLINNPAKLSEYFELQTLFSSDKDFLTTRLSYKFNLKGPSLTIQTACSSSLVAVHIACQSLLLGQCDMALAGGASLQIPWWNGYIVGDVDIRSPDGVCRPFDKNANGTLFGEGAGIVLLKRLEDAFNDGDHIYAVIKGSAINNDGSAKVGYTAPSVDGQVEVITTALGMAEVNGSDISYIETHGTGTPLGDPVEISALTKAFRQYTDSSNFCGIGSVKASIGHLDAAAGIAGLIKTALALHHKTLPASLNFSEPNPLCEFNNSPFYIVKNTQPWNAPVGSKRRAGVSSFGVGGTNAHIILEEAPEQKKVLKSKTWHILPISAKTDTSLKGISQSYAEYLPNATSEEISDIAFTMQQGRQQFPYRQFVVADSHAKGAEQFSSLSASAPVKASVNNDTRIVFMFSGQGSQYLNMGKDLYINNQQFKHTFDQCSDLLLKHTTIDLRQVLFSDNKDNITLLQQTEITQPLLLSFELAIVKVWEALGIVPSAMIGHSIGEYTAACLAGVFTVNDALAIVAERGKIMAAQPSGKMLSISLPASEVNSLLTDDIEIALENSTSLCVVAGKNDAIDSLQTKLEQREIACRSLHTSHAFHSCLMEGAIAPFTEHLNKFKLQTPAIPFISNITGTWITSTEAANPQYWGKLIRHKVNFTSGISRLLEDGYRKFIEIGPGNTLCSFLNSTLTTNGAECKTSEEEFTVVTSVRHTRHKVDDNAHLLSSLGTLWQHGLPVDWSKCVTDEKMYRVPLPTYQFEEKKYWIDPVERIYYGAGVTLEPGISNNNESTTNNSEVQNKNIEKEKPAVLPADEPDDIKTLLLKIWIEVLGVDEISLKSSFFELGGDSMLAVQMFSKLQRKTGVNLQLATLFETPTIEELSKYISECSSKNPVLNYNKSTPGIEQNKTFSFVVAIKPSGNRIPFFCIHGVGGNVLHYKAFLPYLDKEQPLYGIQCRGLDGIQKPFKSVEIMAQHYLEEIIQIQPNGPYQLGGGSMGGLIAFEVAQRLTRLGKNIGLLLLIDSGCPYVVNKLIKKHTHFSSQIQCIKKRSLTTQIIHSISCRVEDIKKLGKLEFYSKQNKPIPHELRYWLIEQKNLAIAEVYNPKPYHGVITMFRALQNFDNPDPYRGWKDAAVGGVTFYDFECNHANIIEDASVARKLNDLLKIK